MSDGWNTIESDAGVFTYLVNELGVKDVQFEELLTLDADNLRRISPVYGVIFLFRYSSRVQPCETNTDGQFDADAANEVFFASQTIQNACGTQALLSVLLNNDEQLCIGPQLKDFKEFTRVFDPELRGEALSNFDSIREIHNSFSRSSPFVNEEQNVAGEDDDVFHFIAYTPVNGMLYELDGLQRAPINHGACSSGDFPDKIMAVLQRRMDQYPASEIHFNLLAVVRDLRILASETGDLDWLSREEDKRMTWQRENALRRHNFLEFAGELIQGIAASKSTGHCGTCDQWIEEAKQTTSKRLQQRGSRNER